MGLDVFGILIAEGRRAHCNLRGTYPTAVFQGWTRTCTSKSSKDYTKEHPGSTLDLEARAGLAPGGSDPSFGLPDLNTDYQRYTPSRW